VGGVGDYVIFRKARDRMVGCGVTKGPAVARAFQRIFHKGPAASLSPPAKKQPLANQLSMP
jgi:hypothetical protein